MRAITILNAAIFDGEKTIVCGSVSFENGLIVENAANAVEVNGEGCTLLPALIDSHTHLYEEDNLKEAAKYGVGTLLDMAVRSPETARKLRNLAGLPAILTSCCPAFTGKSKMPDAMHYPESSRVHNAADAARFAGEQAAAGADYIKVILEEPKIPGQTAFDEAALAALVAEAHARGKKVVAHAVSPSHFALAAHRGIDVITHIPFFKPLPEETIDLLVQKQITVVPTMGVMKAIVKKIKRRNPFLPVSYKNVRKSVEALHKAGVLVLAGTDSNMNDSTTPCEMPYGVSLHEELALMAEAGFSAEEALRSAASLPAQYWGLRDRGVIQVGRRADLILVKGNPARDLNALGGIKRVWIGGVEVSAVCGGA